MNTVPEVTGAQHAGQRWRKVRVVWVIVASGGLLVFAAGLFGIAHPIDDRPEMYFYVNDDDGQPQPSAFPAQGGYFCSPGPFLNTCADVDAKEFDPQVPTVAKSRSFEVWLVDSPLPSYLAHLAHRQQSGYGCHAIAIRVEGKQYTTAELAWLAPLDAAAPGALVLGFLGTVTATYGLTRRKALVMVPVLALPLLVAVAFISSDFLLSGC
jgi:hypothetical protein